MTGAETQGVIFDVKRFALHDGEGIRTTLFLKGCPLRCPWCHNPEGRTKAVELIWAAALCVGCGECERACNRHAIQLDCAKVVIDRQKCVLDANCTTACPSNALKLNGRMMTAKQAYKEATKDEIFYMSKGGVTLSGGEPMAQVPFSLSVLKLCKQNGMNTAVETCLYAGEEDVLSFVRVVDQFFIDIKIFDNDRHKKIIGVGNQIILNNFRTLCDAGADICVRIPLIPGFTEDDENIRSIANFVSGVRKNVEIELLNYNPLAENKFGMIDELYKVGKGVEPLTEQQMAQKRKIVSDIMEA